MKWVESTLPVASAAFAGVRRPESQDYRVLDKFPFVSVSNSISISIVPGFTTTRESVIACLLVPSRVCWQ